MNVLTRGVKNSLRSPIRSGAIVLMFAISIALILSMLVARSSVQSKIDEVKATAGTEITIRPAGTFGPMGGGDPLTAEQLEAIESTSHISSTVMTLTDQLSSDDTTLESALQMGGFGRGNQSASDDSGTETSTESSNGFGGMGGMAMTPSITVTGTNDVNSAATNGGELELTSGEGYASDSEANVAVIGSSLAEENELAVGDTFTMYNETIEVVGIYETGNQFSDGGIVMPLTTLQTITDQADVVSSVVATVDSSDNVASTVSALTTVLGEDADITSEEERAAESVSSLESIASLALTGVIAAAIAGAAIILLAMVMVVRERRREIGVMKAIGGTDGKVVGQFITEGMTLTMFGAVVGMVLGVLVSGPMTTSLVDNQSSSTTTAQQMGGPGGQIPGGSSSSTETDESGSSSESRSGGPGGFVRGGFEQIQSNATQVTATLTPEIIAIALGVTVFISLIGTAIPAWLTARVRPAEVLRTE